MDGNLHPTMFGALPKQACATGPSYTSLPQWYYKNHLSLGGKIIENEIVYLSILVSSAIQAIADLLCCCRA